MIWRSELSKTNGASTLKVPSTSRAKARNPATAMAATLAQVCLAPTTQESPRRVARRALAPNQRSLSYRSTSRAVKRSLVRRSVSTLLRKELDEQGHWQEGRIYLGHVQPDESDKYATPFHEAYTSHAFAATEALIERIEAAAPGAFTGVTPE